MKTLTKAVIGLSAAGAAGAAYVLIQPLRLSHLQHFRIAMLYRARRQMRMHDCSPYDDCVPATVGTRRGFTLIPVGKFSH